MAAVMIGVDPHKASHTAVVISAAEQELGELRVRACAGHPPHPRPAAHREPRRRAHSPDRRALKGPAWCGWTR